MGCFSKLANFCLEYSKVIVKILLQGPMRESVNEVDSQGFNCLYYATYHGHVEIVKLLKRVQVPLVMYKKDDKGTSCLHIAAMRGHANVVQFLLQKTPKVEDDFVGANNVALGNGQKKEKLEVEKEKLARQKKINHARNWEKAINIDERRIDEGFTAVFFAIRSG